MLAYQYDLADAIDGGWLVPVTQRFVSVSNLNFAKLKTKGHGDHADFTDRAVAEVMEREQSLAEVAAGLMDGGSTRPTLVFAAGVGHAEKLSEILNRHPGTSAVAVHGGTSEYPMPVEERRAKIAEFRDGRHQYLVGCDVFYEGFDCPIISRVAIARVTKSRPRYAQAVGRGTRLLPHLEPLLSPNDAAARRGLIAASPKPDCEVLDFVGLGNLSLACSTFDLLASAAKKEVVRRARAKARKSSGAVDVRRLVAEAAGELSAERAREKARQAEMDKWKWMRIERAEVQSTRTDPFHGSGPAVAGGGTGLSRGPSEITEKQERFLVDRGVKVRSGMTKSEAGQLIDLVNRGKIGRPTQKQQDALTRGGERCNVTAAQASILLDLLAARSWVTRAYGLTRDRWKIRRYEDGQFRAVVLDGMGRTPTVVGPSFRTEADCREAIGGLVEPIEVVHGVLA